MPSRNRTRQLWLNVLWDEDYIPESYSRREVIKELLRSIERGDYKLPKGWRVVLEWSNKDNGEMRRGPWQRELTRSAESSSGFDVAVIDYLRRKLQ